VHLNGWSNRGADELASLDLLSSPDPILSVDLIKFICELRAILEASKNQNKRRRDCRDNEETAYFGSIGSIFLFAGDIDQDGVRISAGREAFGGVQAELFNVWEAGIESTVDQTVTRRMKRISEIFKGKNKCIGLHANPFM
jgi:hypothetical protein